MSGKPAYYVVLPGLSSGRWQSGGLLIARKLAGLLETHVDCQVVTSHDREDGVLFLDDLLTDRPDPASVFLVTWGPHVHGLLERLEGRRVVYYAQSTGWEDRLPTTVPVVCLSRYIMAFWMFHAPYNPLFLLGPVLENGCRDLGLGRDVDVLFLERKSSTYLRDTLVPALRRRCRVYTQRQFIPRDDLFGLYNRSKVYLYSSAPWSSGWVEGFGFQPLEAILCGCTVFSNLHGGLADYLVPELNCFKLEVHSTEYDLARILDAVRGALRPASPDPDSLANAYSEDAFHQKAGAIIPALDQYFDHVEHLSDRHAPIRPTPEAPRWRRWLYRHRKAIRNHLSPRGPR